MQSKISELQERQIINIADGKCLGSMKDIELDLEEGRICSIVLPGSTGLWGLLQNKDELLIPWENVVRIGVDVVLVDLPPAETPKTRRWRLSGDKSERWQEELEAYQNELAAGEEDKSIVIRYDNTKNL